MQNKSILLTFDYLFSATKASVVASAVFVLHKKTDLISAPASCVHLIIIIFFVYFKILGISDPLLPLENVFKKIFLGGIFDTLQETFYGKPEESEEAAKQGKLTDFEIKPFLIFPFFCRELMMERKEWHFFFKIPDKKSSTTYQAYFSLFHYYGIIKYLDTFISTDY